MVNNRKIAAIIPARGGSKRIPKKNIRCIAGVPLVAYTIEASKRSRLLDRTVVSTDDEEIERIAKQYGAEVIRRPKELATDTASLEPVLQQVLKELEEKDRYRPYYIVLLQPTTPLRTPEQIDKAIEKALQTNADSVLSVCEAQHYYLSGAMDGDRYLPDYNQRPRSQDMPKRYRENGAIYVTKRDFLFKENNRIGGDIRAIVMDPLSSIDVDNAEEFEFIENLISLSGYMPAHIKDRLKNKS